MKRSLSVLALAGLAIATGRFASPQSEQLATSKSIETSVRPTDNSTHIPPAPNGKSTIMGGEIRNIDPVRDQFSLRAFGEKPIKILFDERTQVFRDGVKIPLRNLGPEEHASVQTVLDGTDVFALSIHILSQTPQGECQGQVSTFNSTTGELTVSSSLSPEPVRIIVPANTLIARQGQSTFTAEASGLKDLAVGTLVTVRFSPTQKGPAVANQITILAVPGSQFLLAGEVSFLDLNSGQLDLVDPRDEKSYQVFFDSTRIPSTRNIHPGDHVRIAATYQAARYVANDISVY
jgi:hypothetical protein